MREWSSGAQTDFTNYAARRLSERGLLREDDPIKLQRAVSEIAYAYAKGGQVGSQFVPGDNPLAPSLPPPQLLGWPSSALREDFDQANTSSNIDALRIRPPRTTTQFASGNSGSASCQGKQLAMMSRRGLMRPQARPRQHSRHVAA